VTCLYDLAPVAVWRHDDPGEAPRYVVDVAVEGWPVPAAALAAIPAGIVPEFLFPGA